MMERMRSPPAQELATESHMVTTNVAAAAASTQSPLVDSQ